MSRLRTLSVLAGLAIFCTSAARLVADEPPPAAGDSPPVFRRIYIPADEIDSRQWHGRYFSVPSDEFRQLLQTVYDGARGAPAAQGASLERADYQATVDEDDLLVGTATWKLSRQADEPTLMPLDPCSLALESAEWSDDAKKPAELGAAPDGRCEVLVEGTTLECRWSQRGERTASGAVTFLLELPGCPLSRVELQAPQGQQVVADRGIVSSADAAEGYKRWTIELGGHNRVTLRLVPEEAGGAAAPLTLLRQATSYEFTSRGINVAAQLTLDVHGEPLKRATIELDPTLHLVAARFGETAVPWSAASDAETGRQHVLLEFPEPVAGTGRVLQLSAVAPLVTGKRFALPGLQPRDMAWQEGTAELLIPDELVLEQLSTHGCRQSRVTALPAPLAGESISVQYFQPDATIDVAVGEPRHQLVVESGALVEVGPAEIASRVSIALEIPPDERRRLRIPIRPDWTVDAVENLQSNRPLKWDIDESPQRPAELQVELKAPGRMVVRGHRATPSTGVFDAGQLRLLDLAQFGGSTRLIGVRAAEGSDLRWIDAEGLDRRDVASLESALQFAPQGDVVLFAEDDRFVQASLTLERRRPNYAVDIRADAVVQQDRLTETYTILCTPDAARVERLLVHFSEQRESPLEWSLAGGNSGQFSARKLSAGEQAQEGLPAGGEVWELLLRLTRSGAFEVRAQRSVPFTKELALALASVHDATTQRGTLAIRALGETGLSIENRRLMSVPAELLDPELYQTARATFHYQPSGDDLGSVPAVSIAPAEAQQAETGAWAWNARLESRFAGETTCVHLATYRIQTAGRRQIRLALPPGAEMQSVWINAERLPLVTSDDGAYDIDLPGGRSRALLSVYFSTPDALPALVSSQSAPFPTLVDLPVMLREWSVWLPPGYQVTDADAGAASGEIVRPTWSERLFAPLGRGAGDRLFNPLATSDWRATFAGSSDVQQSRRACEAVLRNVGLLLGDYANDEEITWGQLLASCHETEAPLGRVLLIDQPGLAQCGVTPQQPVGARWAEQPLARGLQLLSESKLVAIASGNVVLLTGAASASSYPGQLAPSPDVVVHAALRGSLADELQVAARGTSGSRFETVELWRAGVDAPPPSWPEAAVLFAGDPRGWSNYNLQCTGAAPPRIRIVQTAALSSLCWAVFLGIVGIGLWRLASRPWVLVGLSTVAAAAALLLPPAYAPLAAAALLGGLFCLAAGMFRFEPQPAADADPARSSRRTRQSSIVQHVPTILLLAAVVNAAAGLPAAETDASPAPASPRVHRVFVPSDADGQPVGDKYYVPDTLYEELLRKAAALGGRPKDWIVSRATYEGSLSRDLVTSRLGLAALKARFELRVFQANTTVALPLARASWAGAIVAARLDGRTIPVVWNAAGDALVLGPLESERYRLELELEPSVASDAQQAGFELPIPRLARSTLRLSVPPDASLVDVPDARGRVFVDDKQGEVVAQLGTAERLALRWPTGGGMEAAPPNLEVEELVWVNVRPGTTVIDARFKFHVLSGRVRTLRLLADPRLSLLSSPGSHSPVSAVHTIPGDPQRIELELARDVSDDVTVDLSFLVTGTSGVGNLRLPRLESTGARASRRWLAVSIDPTLQPKIQRGEDSRAIDIGEFVAAWGPSDVKPHAAYSIPRGEPVWVLSTQPGEPRTSVEQTLALSLGHGSAALRFDADMNISGGVLVQLGLDVPPGIAVEQVSVLEDEVQRVARWSVADGRVSVFLTAPIDGQQHLSLSGRWTPESPDAFDVPRLRLDTADVKRDELQLYRQSTTLATVTNSASARQLASQDADLFDDFGSLAGCYLLEDDAAAVSVRLSPNDPLVEGVATTRVAREDDHWMAELDYRVDVQGGLADTLHFEVPPQWSEPLRLEPTMRYELVSIPGEQRRQLVLYPDQPLSGRHQVKVRARVAPSPGDRLSVPDVVPLRVRQLERYVVLPRQLEAQQVTWDTLGLVQVALPAELAAGDGVDSSAAAYQVAGEHFQASLKAVQHASARAQVDLLDIHLAWQPDGSYQAVAGFDVEPGGAARCVLELPADCRLLHASVEQLPALSVELPDGRWQLNLGPQQLPQHVEVVYAAAPPAGSSRRHFEAPRLVDLEVGKVLWTIYGLPGFNITEAGASNGQVSPAEQRLMRLGSVAEIVELPPEVVGEHLPEEIARWYAAWRSTYWAARNQLRWDLIAAGRQAAQSEESIIARQLDDRLRAVDERQGATRATSRPTPPSDGSSQLAAVAGPIRRSLHFAGNAELMTLDLNYARAGADAWLNRLLISLTILFVGGTGTWWLRGRTLPTFAPWVIVAGTGLVGWLLLAPSFAGLAALVVALGAALWARFRGGWRPTSA